MNRGVKIIIVHYIKLVIRLLAFITLLVLYITKGNEFISNTLNKHIYILIIIWILVFGEIVIRAFNFGLESMGCQKIFKKNYIEADSYDEDKIIKPRKYSPFIIAGICLTLNGLYAVLYFNGLIDNTILMLISLFYAICDVICVLFYCPFQQWFMKNKCCVSCRIYNWDYALILSPMIFIVDIFTYTLLAAALFILIQWEITYKLHPERFNEATNKKIRCRYCEDRLCKYKKSLQKFIVKEKKKLEAKREQN